MNFVSEVYLTNSFYYAVLIKQNFTGNIALGSHYSILRGHFAKIKTKENK